MADEIRFYLINEFLQLIFCIDFIMQQILESLERKKGEVVFEDFWEVRLASLYPLLVTDFYMYYFPVVSSKLFNEKVSSVQFSRRVCNLILKIKRLQIMVFQEQVFNTFAFNLVEFDV